MLLTIHGLPYSTKYQDLKQLIKDKCNISDFILDNLVSEGSNAKKVRIGLTDDGDGKLLMKCLDGIRLGGSLLHVVPVSKNQPNEGPSLDRQGNAKASTFGNPPQYGNTGQPSQSVLWSGNSNLWQPTPLQTSSYNYDAPANVYPAQQAPIAPRAEIPQLNVHQMDAFQNRPVLQQDHCKPIPPPMHPTRTAALREIQTVDTAPQNMYKPPSNQYVPNKPMTIKKDNFQGPQSNLDLRGSQMQAPKQSNAMLWLTQGHQNDTFSQNIRDSRGPNDRSGRYSPVDVPMNDARRMPPTHRQNDDRLMSQQSHHMSQQDRRISPQGRKMTPQGRRMSPPGRKMSPPGRKMSPQGRRMSPQDRKMSPEGRRMSPQGRKMSPQGRRMSPQGRKMSPQGRRLSPSYRMMQGRKTSPGRQVSPPRRNMEREPDRYSPKRHVPDDTLNPRPRFDGSNTRPPAPSQAIYGDGFRGNVQYPVTAARPQLSSWQFGNNKPEDDRRPNYEPRAPSPRKSRSPVRRGRSPLKDRFKRHSPSPRSPRRSWALEKRRSPDVTEAPPPPNWPGSKEDTYPPNKPDTFPGVWDRNKYDEIQSPESDSMRSNTRPSRDATPPHRQMYKSEQPQYEAPAPKVSKHQLVEEDRRDFRHPHSMRSDVMDVQIDRPVVRDLLKDRQDYRQPPKSEQQSREEDIVQKRLNTYKRREPEPTRYEEKKPLRVTERLDKEIEDIYKRTAEFKKKAEVFRNAEERRREEERRKDEAFQESLRHSMERDPPKDRHDFRKDDQRPDDRRPDDRRFGRDDFRKRSLPRSTNQEMHQQVDQSRMPQFESNRGVMDKEDLKSKSLDRRDDRRDHRWVDRREDRRDDRRDGRSHEKPEDHRADRHDDRRIVRKDDHYNPRVDEHRKQDQKDKACSELAERMLDRRENKKWKSDLRLQVKEALRQSIMKILNDMFKDKEASFIEYTVKFRAYYDENDQDKIFDKVMTNLNALPFKRPAPDKISTSSHHKDKLSQKRPSSDQDKLKSHSKVPRTSGKDAHSKTVSDANVKVEDKLMEVEEKAIAKIEADAQEDAQTGIYALNPLLTRSLEAELQDVMIKVWQVFPDDTDSDAEALVADKFRNQAGDDLRNMLGLNVTQRLLNIFNPLYVKLTFSSPPKRDVFKTFLKKYNITSYKELDPKGLSYLALAKDIATFDSLCNGNQKASGNIKVTVQPCYRFNGCPKNLECSYTKQAKVTDKTIKKTTEIPKTDADKTNKQVNAPIVNKTEAPSAKVSKISEATKANKPIQKQSAESSVTYADKIKTAVKKVSPLAQKTGGEKLNKTVPSKAEVTSVKQEPKTPQNKANVTLQKSTATVAKSVKIANKVDSVKAEPKTAETKSAVKTPTVVTKPTGNTTAKIAQIKLPAKAEPQTKATPKVDDSSASQDKISKLQSNVSNEVQKKVTVNATKANIEANKAKTPQKSLNTPKIESNPNTNNTGKDKAPTATNISPKNAKAVAAKTTPNKKPVSKMTPKPKVNNQKKLDYVEDDDEELNDEEILKLLGGGIILDECSGSDLE